VVLASPSRGAEWKDKPPLLRFQTRTPKPHLLDFTEYHRGSDLSFSAYRGYLIPRTGKKSLTKKDQSKPEPFLLLYDIYVAVFVGPFILFQYFFFWVSFVWLGWESIFFGAGNTRGLVFWGVGFLGKDFFFEDDFVPSFFLLAYHTLLIFDMSEQQTTTA
jgi:hypothetical protein